MKLSVLAGATSQTINIFVQDSSSAVGAGLTGLVFNTASLVAYYAFPKAAAVQITLVTLAAITTAWTSGGFKEVDATNMPGWYRLDLPNATIAAASGRFVSVHLKGAANMAPVALEIELTGWDNQNATTAGLTNLDAAISTRMATFTLPTNFSTLSIDGSGRVDLGKWIGSAPNALVSGSVPSISYTQTGTAQAGTASTITLAAGAVATDSYYNDQMVVILSSTGVGQARLITGYVGATKVATITPNWATNPSATSVYAVVAGDQTDLALWLGVAPSALTTGLVQATLAGVAFPANFSILSIDGSGRVDLGKWIGVAPNALNVGRVDSMTSLRYNTAQAGAASTITLDAGANGTDNFFNDCIICIVANTGINQSRLITGYVGATKVATVTPAWTTNPDNTSQFVVIPAARSDTAQWLGTTPNALISGRVDANTQAVGSGLWTVKKNTALAKFEFVMYDSTDHISPKTSLTITAQRSIDGGAFAACANAVTELSNGVYYLDLAATDLNGNVIMLRFTATGADATLILVLTQP